MSSVQDRKSYYIVFGNLSEYVCHVPVQSLSVVVPRLGMRLVRLHCMTFPQFHRCHELHIIPKLDEKMIETACFNIEMTTTFIRDMVNSTQNFQYLTTKLSVDYGMQTNTFMAVDGSHYFINQLQVSIENIAGDMKEISHSPSTEEKTISVSTTHSSQLGFTSTFNPSDKPTATIGLTGQITSSQQLSYQSQYYSTIYQYWPKNSNKTDETPKKKKKKKKRKRKKRKKKN